MMFKEQADKCRQQASEFAGKPEAPFLLRVASAFDDLAVQTDERLITRIGQGGGRESAAPLNA
jgi:hypothetical protein